MPLNNSSRQKPCYRCDRSRTRTMLSQNEQRKYHVCYPEFHDDSQRKKLAQNSIQQLNLDKLHNQKQDQITTFRKNQSGGSLVVLKNAAWQEEDAGMALHKIQSASKKNSTRSYAMVCQSPNSYPEQIYQKMINTLESQNIALKKHNQFLIEFNQRIIDQEKILKNKLNLQQETFRYLEIQLSQAKQLNGVFQDQIQEMRQIIWQQIYAIQKKLRRQIGLAGLERTNKENRSIQGDKRNESVDSKYNNLDETTTKSTTNKNNKNRYICCQSARYQEGDGSANNNFFDSNSLFKRKALGRENQLQQCSSNTSLSPHLKQQHTFFSSLAISDNIKITD